MLWISTLTYVSIHTAKWTLSSIGKKNCERVRGCDCTLGGCTKAVYAWLIFQGWGFVHPTLARLRAQLGDTKRIKKKPVIARTAPKSRKGNATMCGKKKRRFFYLLHDWNRSPVVAQAFFVFYTRLIHAETHHDTRSTGGKRWPRQWGGKRWKTYKYVL